MMKLCTYARLMIALAIMSLAAQVQAAEIYLTVPDTYNASNPDWYVWAWADGQQGYWVPSTTLSNGHYQFTVTDNNIQIVRMNPANNGNPSWNYVWNQTSSLPVVADATYKITGWGLDVAYTVYLDPSAVTETGNVWYAWSFPAGGSGSWVAGTQSGGVYAFDVPTTNDQVIFVRMNANGAPSWDNGIKLNQTNDLTVQVEDTYVITDLGTDKMVGYWASQVPPQNQITLESLASDEYYLPDHLSQSNVVIDSDLYGVYAIKWDWTLNGGNGGECNILIACDTDPADHKWNQNEAEFSDFTGLKIYQYSRLFKQNNWILLRLPQAYDAEEYVAKKISNVQGQINVTNTFDIDMDVTSIGQAVNIEPVKKNVYCVPYFNIHDMGRIYNENLRAPGYFLILPKPNEVAIVNWCKYPGYLSYGAGTHYFETPEHTDVTNYCDLKGKVKVDFRYCYAMVSEGVDPDGPDRIFEEDGAYDILALVKTEAHSVQSPQWAPRRAKSQAEQAADEYFGIETKQWDINYVVYPLLVDRIDNEDHPTAVVSIDADREVKSIEFYNVSGQCANKPFDGINIVRTTYSDGSVQITKQLMK